VQPLYAQAVIVPEISVGTTLWASVKAYERSLLASRDTVEMAHVLTTTSFGQLGGFDQTLNAAEDGNRPLCARQQGYTIAQITAMASHKDGTLGYGQSPRKKGSYVCGLRNFARKQDPVAVGQIMRHPYLQRPRIPLNQPRLSLGLILLKGGELSAAVSGFVARSAGWEVSG